MGKLLDKTKEVTSTLISGRLEMLGFVSPKFCVFIVALVFLYITNHISVERDLKRISELKNEIKDLRYESITTSSELMNMSKQSEVYRRVQAEGIGLKEQTEPPRIIE
ncbi:MAG: hypothetical protein MJZ13_04735 [Bacteroidales bacterium]|nr:hypothetical protein [Bacteroidales bacterium]